MIMSIHLRRTRWSNGLQAAGRAAAALAVASLLLLGLVQVPGGPAIGAEAAPSVQAPPAVTQP